MIYHEICRDFESWNFESWRGVVIMMGWELYIYHESLRGIMIIMGWELDIYHESWRGIMIMMGWVLDIL